MVVVTAYYKAMVPGSAPGPKVDLRFRLLREGEVTAGVKFLRFFRGLSSLNDVQLVFWAEEGEGEFTQTCRVDLSTLLAQGEWLAMGSDA
jgi:hypothetical protein